MIIHKLIDLGQRIEDVKLDIVGMRQSKDIKGNLIEQEQIEEIYDSLDEISQNLTKLRCKVAEFMVNKN